MAADADLCEQLCTVCSSQDLWTFLHIAPQSRVLNISPHSSRVISHLLALLCNGTYVDLVILVSLPSFWCCTLHYIQSYLTSLHIPFVMHISQHASARHTSLSYYAHLSRRAHLSSSLLLCTSLHSLLLCVSLVFFTIFLLLSGHTNLYTFLI